MILLKNGHLYSPNYQGKKDVLIGGGKILKIEDHLELDKGLVEWIDCTDKVIYPGFIDGHVHITGGGGEGSFKTRTPEISLSDITSAGVTTVVGCLGTDGTTRNMKNLLAKAYGLEEEGVSTFVYSGSYQVPVKTLMDTIEDDIVLVEKIIGVGEIAISDHRSSVPSLDALSSLTSSARVAGMLSGKGGVVNVHLGDGKDGLKLLKAVHENSEIPLSQFWPTHINRNQDLFEEGLAYAKAGGYIDFTTSTTPEFIEMGEVPAPQAIKKALEEGVSDDRITLTSDGQGSLPEFDEANNLCGLRVGRLSSLYEAVVDSVKVYGVPLEQALKTITSNPAAILKLKHKGKLERNFDGDLVIADKDTLVLEGVIAKGQWMVKDKKIVVKGTFE